MSTIQMTKPWKPKSDNNLVDSIQIKKEKKLSVDYKTQNSNFCAKDMMGLSWILLDDMENDV